MTSGWRGTGVGLHDAIRRSAEGTQVDAVLHVVLLQLGQDVFPIRVLPQGGDVGPDLMGNTRLSVHIENPTRTHFSFTECQTETESQIS